MSTFNPSNFMLIGKVHDNETNQDIQVSVNLWEAIENNRLMISLPPANGICQFSRLWVTDISGDTVESRDHIGNHILVDDKVFPFLRQAIFLRKKNIAYRPSNKPGEIFAYIDSEGSTGPTFVIHDDSLNEELSLFPWAGAGINPIGEKGQRVLTPAKLLKWLSNKDLVDDWKRGQQNPSSL